MCSRVVSTNESRIFCTGFPIVVDKLKDMFQTISSAFYVLGWI